MVAEVGSDRRTNGDRLRASSVYIRDRQAVSWSLRDRHQSEPAISLRPSVDEILRRHVTLKLERIDRMYLNLYVPQLQHEGGVVTFFRIPRSHRYLVTDFGLRSALFFTRTYARLLRPGLAEILGNDLPTDPRLQSRFRQLQLAIDQWVEKANLAA